MSKKRKHYETCMHCAFLHAFRLKYITAKERQDDKAFNELVESAIKITAMVFSKISLEDQRQFIAQAAEQSGSLERLREMVQSLVSETQGPTKH